MGRDYLIDSNINQFIETMERCAFEEVFSPQEVERIFEVIDEVLFAEGNQFCIGVQTLSQGGYVWFRYHLKKGEQDIRIGLTEVAVPQNDYSQEAPEGWQYLSKIKIENEFFKGPIH